MGSERTTTGWVSGPFLDLERHRYDTIVRPLLDSGAYKQLAIALTSIDAYATIVDIMR